MTFLIFSLKPSRWEDLRAGPPGATGSKLRSMLTQRETQRLEDFDPTGEGLPTGAAYKETTGEQNEVYRDVSPILNLEEISGNHLTEYYKIWGRVWTRGNHTSMAISRGIYEFCTHHIDKRWFAKGNHSESCEVLWFSGV